MWVDLMLLIKKGVFWMMILNGKTPIMFWLIIKQSNVKNRHVYADKAMLVHSITTAETAEGVLKNLNIGMNYLNFLK